MIKHILRGYDILGEIAILKFIDNASASEKKQEARKLMSKHNNIKTVLEKTEKVKGRLRTIKTKYILGKNTKIALYRESNCIFKFDIDKCYFSPRLSNERLELANIIRKIKSKQILVLFAGVAPFSIVIAKNAKSSKIYSIELNKIANKYAKENIKLNKVNNVKIIQGDVKKLGTIIKNNKLPSYYDIIVMPRAQLKETFLKQALSVSKRGTIIFYYDFCLESEIKDKVKSVEFEAKKYKKKIKIIRVKKAGDIAPYKFRIRIDFKII